MKFISEISGALATKQIKIWRASVSQMIYSRFLNVMFNI